MEQLKNKDILRELFERLTASYAELANSGPLTAKKIQKGANHFYARGHTQGSTLHQIGLGKNIKGGRER